jgi:hypothetical protein
LVAKWPAVAQHVRPAAKGPKVSVRVIADPPRGGYQAPLVAVRTAVELEVAVADSDRERPDGFGALGGVFRQVRGYRCVGQLACFSDFDDAGVELATPGDVPAERAFRVRDSREPGGPRDVLDDVGELLGTDPSGRDDAGGIVAVEAEDGVKMHQAASLEFSNLRVGQPHWVSLLVATQPDQAATEADRGATPQLGCVRVPDDCSAVVVAVGA